jgi:hypothetical protein
MGHARAVTACQQRCSSAGSSLQLSDQRLLSDEVVEDRHAGSR